VVLQEAVGCLVIVKVGCLYTWYDTCISAARAPLLEGRDPFVPRFPGEEHPLDTFYLLPAVNPYYI
jgi:hypothetical protein